MKFIYFLFFIFCWIFSPVISLCQDNCSLHVLHDVSDEEVMIRWAPFNYNCWQLGVDKGYNIYRITTKENGVELSDSARTESGFILAADLKPLPSAEMELLPLDSNLVDIAWGTLYSDEFEIEFEGGDTTYLQIYEYSLQRENRFNFALMAADRSFEIAEATGVGFRDTTVALNSSYIYYVYIPSDDSLQPFPAFKALHVAVEQSSLPLDTIDIYDALPGDRSATLVWSNFNYSHIYASYIIERSDDNGVSFHPRTEHPFVSLESDEADPEYIYFTDSLPENDIPYIFRLKGLNYFGREGPYSDTVSVIGKPGPLGVGADLLSHMELETNELLLNWSFPDSLEPLIAGFNVLRSSQQRGPFEILNAGLLSADTRNFADTAALPDAYYRVIAEDLHGHENPSIAHLAQLNDTIPPALPTGLGGEVKKSGQVFLSWNSNDEPDLYGYRLYRSDSPKGDFMQVSNRVIRDTSFIDVIDLMDLDRYVYYKILAVDNRQNESELSPTVELEKPDLVPPSPPVLLQLEQEADAILVHFNRSTSQDVATHRLQRLQVGQDVWNTLPDFETQESYRDTIVGHYIFGDTTVEALTEYRYKLIAIDNSGNESVSRIFTGRSMDDRVRGTIADGSIMVIDLPTTDASVTWNHLRKGILLQWDYSGDTEIKDFVVYRQRIREPLRIHKTLVVENGIIKNPSWVRNLTFHLGYLTKEFFFLDTQITRAGYYEYRIIARHFDGGFSQMSEVLYITVN